MMLIQIQNQGSKWGRAKYTIHVNNEFIIEFWHKREDGLGRCLMEAWKAVEKNKWESLKKVCQEENELLR